MAKEVFSWKTHSLQEWKLVKLIGILQVHQEVKEQSIALKVILDSRWVEARLKLLIIREIWTTSKEFNPKMLKKEEEAPVSKELSTQPDLTSKILRRDHRMEEEQVEQWGHKWIQIARAIMVQTQDQGRELIQDRVASKIKEVQLVHQMESIIFRQALKVKVKKAKKTQDIEFQHLFHPRSKKTQISSL